MNKSRKTTRAITITFCFALIPIVIGAYLDGKYAYVLFMLGMMVFHLSGALGSPTYIYPVKEDEPADVRKSRLQTLGEIAGGLLMLLGGLYWYVDGFINNIL